MNGQIASLSAGTLLVLGATSAAGQCPLSEIVRPLPAREQAAVVRAELVHAALAELKPARLVRELRLTQVRRPKDQEPQGLAAYRATRTADED